MPVDFDILKSVGTTDERLRDLCTAAPFAAGQQVTKEEQDRKDEDIKIRKKLETLIGNRLMENIEFSMQNHYLYSSVDLAWDSTPINKATYPMMLYAQGKLDLNGCASSLSNLACATRYLVTDAATKKVTGINLPKFFDVNVNLVRSVITRRLAAQSNKYNNLYPFYKYESRSTSIVGKLRADIISQRMDIMADQFDHRHHDVQVFRDTLLYGHCVDFVRCAWERDMQWEKEEQPEELMVTGVVPKKTTIVKEGVAFTNPHPTRVFWDNAYPLSSINTDTGGEYIGFWDVVRYKDVAFNTKYWNRHTINYSSNVATLFSTYAQYFSQYYCTIRPPTLGADLTGSNDRKNNLGIYAGDMNDTSMILANYYGKLIPKDWGIGEYPYPVWIRFVCAGENTIVYAEILPSTPAAVSSYNENDNRQVNISVAHELMGYQDQMTNLLSYLLACIRADNVKVMVVDVDAVGNPAMLTDFRNQIKARDFNSETMILEVSVKALRDMGVDPSKVVQLVETKATGIDIIFRAMTNLVQLVERLMALSPQEQGQPSPREITATESNMIAGTTESVYGFISDAFDEFRSAKKRILYESFIAMGDQQIRVPVISRYTPGVVRKAGLETLPEEVEYFRDNSAPRKQTIIGTKDHLIHDYIFTSRDGAERPVNSQSANTLVQLMAILQSPIILTALGKEKLYEIINEVFRMSGAGVDMKLELAEGEPNAVGVDPNQQIQKVLEQLTQNAEQTTADIQQLSQRMDQMAEQAKQQPMRNSKVKKRLGFDGKTGGLTSIESEQEMPEGGTNGESSIAGGDPALAGMMQ